MKHSDEQIAAWLHGSADAEDAARIEARLADDAELAARAGRLRKLDDLVRQAVPLEDALPAALLARLGIEQSDTNDNVVQLSLIRSARAEAPAAPPTRFAAFTSSGWASSGWRVAAQVLIVFGLGFGAAQWIGAPDQPEPRAAYRTLGDAPEAELSANALVLFAEGTDAAAARAMISDVSGRIVDEPSRAGTWQIRVDPGRRDQVLARLRAMSGVRMAEPIDGK